MNKKKMVIAAILVSVLGGLAVWRLGPWNGRRDGGPVLASGTVDATEVLVSFRVPGILRDRPVEEGSRVKAGDLLGALDDREAVAHLRQAEAAEQAARARLQDLQSGYRPQEIAEVRAQAELARANLTNLEAESRRSEALFGGGAVSRQRRDKDTTAAAVAVEQYRASQERLKLLQSGYRPATIQAARAQLGEAQAAVDVARVLVGDLRVTAPVEGMVTRTHAERGETLGAGRPVATVTDISKPWVRVYIPESLIGLVRIGAPARIKVDTFPGREFAGRVSYVSPQAEFTPKNVQTQEERVKLVFAVNVVMDNQDGAIKPGMPADVSIDARDGAEK